MPKESLPPYSDDKIYGQERLYLFTCGVKRSKEKKERKKVSLDDINSYLGCGLLTYENFKNIINGSGYKLVEVIRCEEFGNEFLSEITTVKAETLEEAEIECYAKSLGYIDLRKDIRYKFNGLETH